MYLRDIQPKNLITHAFHEADHSVIHYKGGTEISQVSIIPTDRSAGTIDYVFRADIFDIYRLYSDSEMRDRVEGIVMGCCAGPFAEARFKKRPYRLSRNHHDARNAYNFLSKFQRRPGDDCEGIATPSELDAYWKLLKVRAETLVNENWEAIDHFARALLSHGQIPFAEFDHVLSDYFYRV